METILITGGLGYVGGRLSDFFIKKGHKVIISSRAIPNSTVKKYFTGAEFVLHRELINGKFDSKVDIVIHTAALNEIDCMRLPNQAIDVNINHTRILAEWASQNGVNHFLYLSTAHVYKNPMEGVINEFLPTNPIHPYGITHKAAEDYVMAASIKSNMKVSIVRMSNSFGQPITPFVNRWTLLVNDLCRQLAENKTMKLQSDGSAMRDFISLSDVCCAIDFLVFNKADSRAVYNLGSGISMTISDMAFLIKDRYESLFDLTVEIDIPNSDFISNEHFPILKFSIEKLNNIGFVPKNDFIAEIDAMHLFCNRYFG